MYWHCQTAQYSEGAGYLDDFSGRSEGIDRLYHNFFQQKRDVQTTIDFIELYDHWLVILRDYYRRELTLRTDILLALSGVAPDSQAS